MLLSLAWRLGPEGSSCWTTSRLYLFVRLVAGRTGSDCTPGASVFWLAAVTRREEDNVFSVSFFQGVLNVLSGGGGLKGLEGNILSTMSRTVLLKPLAILLSTTSAD